MLGAELGWTCNKDDVNEEC